MAQQQPRTRFRLTGKAFFLTYPQCETPKEVVMENLRIAFDDATLIVVAEEAHEDGSPHLHCIITFNKRKDIKDANPLLDTIGGKHGNYQACRNARKTLRYVCKDGNFIHQGEMPDISIKVKLQNMMATSLLEGKTFKDLVSVDAGYAMQHKRKLEDFERWVKRQRIDEERPQWMPLYVDTPVDFYQVEGLEKTNAYPMLNSVLEWVNSNIRRPRQPRQKQLWLGGLPGIGKSRFLALLRERLRVYDVPKDEEYYDDYEDGCYDLAVLDEFKHQKRIQWMNTFCDGNPLPLRQKGHQVVKRDNLPVIVVSNFRIFDCYRAGVALDALTDRFLEVYLEHPFKFGYQRPMRASDFEPPGSPILVSE